MTQLEFLNIVTPFKDKVFRLAKRLLVSREEAEDATQEVLIKLWKNKTKIKDYKNVEAFSMTMTKNFCYDKLKSKQAQNLKIDRSAKYCPRSNHNLVRKPCPQSMVTCAHNSDSHCFSDAAHSCLLLVVVAICKPCK